MTRVRKLVLGAAIAAFAVATSAAPILAQPPPEVDPELAGKLQAKLDRWRVNHAVPGMAVAIRLPGGAQWIGTSGTTTAGKKAQPVLPDTPYAIASLTKSFAAATILQLRDERVLRLSDPISRWLPNYPKARKVTVRMLLNHRSGIFDYFAHPRYEQKVFGRPTHRWSVKEILRLTGPRYCRPGKCYHYSNTNYVLLGKIIKKATGKSPATHIRKRFLDPLGLTDTFFQGFEPIGKFPAKGYLLRPGGYRGFSDGSRFRPNTSAATVTYTAAALVSSVRDVSDWQDALFGGEVLSERSLEQMMTLHPRSGYGLGMRVEVINGIVGIGHGGSLRGYVSIMYRLPTEDYDVVILSNLGRTSLHSLTSKLTTVALKSLEPSGAPIGP